MRIRKRNTTTRGGVYVRMKRERTRSRRFGALTPIGSLTVFATISLAVHKLPEVAAAQEPRGVGVNLLRNCTPKEEREQGDGRWIWVRLKEGGGVYVNEEQIKPGSLIAEMSKTMESRQERSLYLVGDDAISYNRVAKTAADLQGAIPDLNILLPTSSNMRNERYPCLTLVDPRGWGASLWGSGFASTPPFP